MYDLAEHTDLESNARRLVPESQTEYVYGQLPFDVEGLMFKYPAATLRNQIEKDGWYKLLKAEAGSNGEITGTVYLHEPFYHTVGLLHFKDPAREIGMVADGDVLRQVTGNMLTYDDWRVVSTHVDLDEQLYEAVVQFFQE